MRLASGIDTPRSGPTATDGRPLRVLILSASVGSGHLRAAEAIELALRQLQPDAFVRNEDVLALATAPLRFSFADMYLKLIAHAPQVLGYFYGLFDRPIRPSYGRWYQLKVALERMNMRPLCDLLAAEPWDLVINTFFLSTEIVASQRRRGLFNAPQVQVVTDFESHRNWVNRPCEMYFTPTEESALYLQCFGVPRSDAAVTGIPIHPVFAQPKDRDECRARQGLAGDRPVLLLCGGGHGVGPMAAVYRSLLEIQLPVQVVAVAGRNPRAKARLESVPVPARHRVQIRGYTDEMDELLAAADLVVTKPGGLTTSEALARGAGMVLVHPVPGQEERNSDYLLENGAAIKVNHLPTMAHKIEAVLRNPPRLAQLRANARRLARPRAAFEVVERSLALLPSAAPAQSLLVPRGNGDGVPRPIMAYNGRPEAAVEPARVDAV